MRLSAIASDFSNVLLALPNRSQQICDRGFTLRTKQIINFSSYVKIIEQVLVLRSNLNPNSMKTSIDIHPAYEEIIDFLAAVITPQSLVQFQVSESIKERVADLIFREKNEGISLNEKSELDHYLVIEHLLRLAKTRAYDFIQQEP
jgi:hypothetical protein